LPDRPSSDTVARLRRIRWVLFAAGLVVSLVMVARAQVGWDQFQLLLVGWEFAETGVPTPYGAGMSGGGLAPGPASSLVHGLPLLIARDHRMVGLAILLTHVAAYLLLDRMLRGILDPRERLLFCVLYWLNPWRLFHSAHIWNPNWLFLLAAIHFATAFRQRRVARFRDSFAHTLAIGVAFQLHAAAVLLPAATAVLVVRRRMRLSWPGVVAGALVLGLSMVPYLLAVQQHPEILPPGGDDTLERVTKTPHRIGRGVLYWIRYASHAVGQKMLRLDFTPLLGAGTDAWLTPLVRGLAAVSGAISILLALAANVWLWRKRQREPLPEPDRNWLFRCVRLSFVAALIVFLISPVTIMSWQVFSLFHLTVLPVVLWLGATWRRRPLATRSYVAAFATASLLLTAAMSVANERYRECSAPLKLKYWHPAVTLGLEPGTAFEIDPRLGTPPNMLEEERWDRAGKPPHPVDTPEGEGVPGTTRRRGGE
jgi:hypothetical protein